MAGGGEKWKPASGSDFHNAALSGRPVLAWGTPRYGPAAARHGLIFFETGNGWREVDTYRRFDPVAWQALDEPPERE